MGAFSDGVFAQVRRVPRGKCATYGQIARLMGRPRSARYVGYALRSNPAPGSGDADVPCHRVVFKDGSLCRVSRSAGPRFTRAMLEEEGVAFLADGRVDLCGMRVGSRVAGTRRILCPAARLRLGAGARRVEGPRAAAVREDVPPS